MYRAMNAATVGKSFRMGEIIHKASRGTYHLRSLIILDSIFFPLNHFRLLSILNSTNIPYPQIGSGQTKSFEGVPFRRESAACNKAARGKAGPHDARIACAETKVPRS